MLTSTGVTNSFTSNIIEEIGMKFFINLDIFFVRIIPTPCSCIPLVEPE